MRVSLLSKDSLTLRNQRRISTDIELCIKWIGKYTRIDTPTLVFWIILTREVCVDLEIGNSRKSIAIEKIFLCLRSDIENLFSLWSTREKCYNRRESRSCSNTNTERARILQEKLSICSGNFEFFSWIHLKDRLASSSIRLELDSESNVSTCILDDRI